MNIASSSTYPLVQSLVCSMKCSIPENMYYIKHIITKKTLEDISI